MEQVGAGKDDETEGLGRLGGKLRRRNWRQGLTGASRPDINRERSATERFRSASLWLAVWSEAEHRLTQSRVPGRAALIGWGLASHPFKDGRSGQSLNSRRSLTLPAQGFLEAGGPDDCLKKDTEKARSFAAKAGNSLRTFGPDTGF